MTSGIYKIENKKTGQIYIGQSKNIEKRFALHCNVPRIDMDIATYGKENFNFDILEKVNNNKKQLLEREDFWIKEYGTDKDDYHYNALPKWLNAYGSKHPISLYTLWNTEYCTYLKGNMYQKNRIPNPCSCFVARYKGYQLSIGGFYDFLSCEIIGGLIDSFIND